MSSRRARYADDETNDDDEDSRALRSKEMRSKRPPTPDGPEPPSDDRPSRRSILVDPNEDPKDRATRRHSRSNSQVRIKPPPSNYHSSDDDNATVDGRYVRHRNGKVEFISDDNRKREPKKRTHDLERKTSNSDGHFRAKRDGYKSDEGEQLKKSKKYGDKIGDVDSDDDRRPPKVKVRTPAERSKSQRRDSWDDDKRALPDRTRRRSANPDTFSGVRSRDAPRRRNDSDDEDPPPRRTRPSRKAYDSDHDRGYDTEGAGRRRRGWDDKEDKRGPRHADRRSARFDDDPYPPRRRPDPRDDRLRPPRPRHDDDDRRYRTDDRPIRRARSDVRPRERDGGRRAKSPRDKRNDWAKTAGAVFMSQAMPVIKREGGKWAKKEFENWMAQRR